MDRLLPKRNRRWLLAAAILGVFAVSFTVFFPRYLRARLVAKAKTIRIGDARDHVAAVLGAPTERFAQGTQLTDSIRQSNPILYFLISPSPETWCYGAVLDWRMFGPDEEDLTVEFNADGGVTKVTIPKSW
jgi:hypothetical protein